MSKIYVITYMDIAILDYKIYGSFEVALKEYVSNCIDETRKIVLEKLDDDDSDSNTVSVISSSGDDLTDYSSISDDEGIATCILQVLELDTVSHEYVTVKEYDIDTFQEFLGEMENLDQYLEGLEDKLKNDELSEDLFLSFTP